VIGLNVDVSRVVRLSLRGRTIIISIHQPRFAIFKLFDRLSLLAGGRTVYHGKATEALKFFESIGIVFLNCACNYYLSYIFMVFWLTTQSAQNNYYYLHHFWRGTIFIVVCLYVF